MTEIQKKRFIEICKECGIEPVEDRYYQLCYTDLLKGIYNIAKTEKLHDGYRWLIDSWILEYNRVSRTEQSANYSDLKVGMAKSSLDPVDFLYDRLLEIKKYRRMRWKTKLSYS